MITENLKASGQLSIVLTDEFGRIKEQVERNLVVTAGKAFVTSRITGASTAVMSHMGVGTGTVAAAAADTALGTQVARVALTSTTRVTTNVTNDAVQYLATFPAGIGTGALTEAGLFNSASGGDMFARTVFPVINKGANDSITITWKITFS